RLSAAMFGEELRDLALVHDSLRAQARGIEQAIDLRAQAAVDPARDRDAQSALAAIDHLSRNPLLGGLLQDPLRGEAADAQLRRQRERERGDEAVEIRRARLDRRQ